MRGKRGICRIYSQVARNRLRPPPPALDMISHYSEDLHLNRWGHKSRVPKGTVRRLDGVDGEYSGRLAGSGNVGWS